MDSKASLDYATRVRRAELTQVLAQSFNNTVQAGPFAGTTITLQRNWGDGDIAPKLLGVYEQELHESIEKIIKAAPEIVINVGCAEGFYAVGMAQRLLGSRVIAFDIDQTSLMIASKNAIDNGVDNIEMGDSCQPENLEYLISAYTTGVVISDCEGFEMTLLDPVLVPSLSRCHMLIECHDMIIPGITDTLCERFVNTHFITKIKQTGRNPYELPWLEKLTDTDKWALMNEMRGETMHWLFMEPKS